MPEISNPPSSAAEQEVATAGASLKPELVDLKPTGVENFSEGDALVTALTSFGILVADIVVLAVVLVMLPRFIEAFLIIVKGSGEGLAQKPTVSKKTSPTEDPDLAAVIGLAIQMEMTGRGGYGAQRITFNQARDQREMWGAMGRLKTLARRKT